MRLSRFACLAGVILSSTVAFACSYADITPRSCNLLANRGESVFVGTVVSVDNPPADSYELNVLPDSEYAIMANTNFCDPETASSPLKFLGGSAPAELTIKVPDTKCGKRPRAK